MAWFPITDPLREADIRMRRRRGLLLLSCVVFLPWLYWTGHGGSRPTRERVAARWSMPAMPSMSLGEGGDGALRREVAASSLTVDLPCASTVTVLPDPALRGRAVASVAPGAEVALDTLFLAAGSITQSAGCRDHHPVTIRVGNVTPLALVQSGDNTLRTGDFQGPVTVEVRGDGDVQVGSAGSLSVVSSGSGDVSVGGVGGVLTATLNGSGDLSVAGGTIPVLQAISASSGDLMLSNVTVLGGRVLLQGSGDFRLGRLSGGAFDADTRGSGDLTIDDAEIDHLALRGEGSGDVVIRRGRIDTLDAVREGSGDLSIGAGVGGGRLVHHGDGDVTLPPDAMLERSGGD